MPRYAVVQSDTEEEEEEACSTTDEMSQPGEEEEEEAYEEPCNPLLVTVVEALEFAIRNVPIHGEHLRVANEALGNLRTMSSVLFHQALSPRWSPAFVDVLKRARMVRVRFLMGNASAQQLLRFGTRCRMCGAAEPRCQVALDLIGNNDDAVGRCADMVEMADAFDGQLDRDAALFTAQEDGAFLGTYAGGRRCFDLAMAAVLARNLVGDTAYEVCWHLGVRLEDADLREALEQDERDPTRPLYALTDVRFLADRLAKRIQVVEDVLRGRPFPEAHHKQSGSAEAWKQLSCQQSNRSGHLWSGSLPYGATRAAANLQQQQQQQQAADEGEEEAEDALVPPPPPPQPPPPPPVSSRTRAGRQRSKAPESAPVSSRTRARMR